MATRSWLLLDMNNLAWRAFHTTGTLAHEGQATGVAFGIFRDIKQLSDRFPGHGFVFCFDHGKSERKKLFPDYKISREKKLETLGEDELEARESCGRQIDKFKFEWLWDCGFTNVFYQSGYEADDVIASVVRNLEPNEDAVVVSGDEDLYQLLGPRVMVYKPQGGAIVTHKTFRREYGIEPKYWHSVKALAGCAGDDIPGLRGCGEKSACRYIAHLAYKTPLTGVQTPLVFKISHFLKTDEYRLYKKLVQLPFEGTRHFVPGDNVVHAREIREVMGRLGMKELQKQYEKKTFGLKFGA